MSGCADDYFFLHDDSIRTGRKRCSGKDAHGMISLQCFRLCMTGSYDALNNQRSSEYLLHTPHIRPWMTDQRPEYPAEKKYLPLSPVPQNPISSSQPVVRGLRWLLSLPVPVLPKPVHLIPLVSLTVNNNSAQPLHITSAGCLMEIFHKIINLRW